MIRRIIEIDRDKCNGCGACAAACHEGAIGIVDGKALLLRDDYCDGLGDCLPSCPTGAITFTHREAAEYNESAVAENLAAASDKDPARRRSDIAPNSSHSSTDDDPIVQPSHRGPCPGHSLHVFNRSKPAAPQAAEQSQLGQWPCQIRLMPPTAACLNGAELLIAADCTAFAYSSIHRDYMSGRVTLIGCPKLDGVDYTARLTEIMSQNRIRSVTVLRMEVPCCGGLEAAAREAVRSSGHDIPYSVVTVSVDGKTV